MTLASHHTAPFSTDPGVLLHAAVLALALVLLLLPGHPGGTSPRSWIDVEVRKTRTQRTVEAYVAMLLAVTG